MSNRRPPRTLGPAHDPFWEYCSNEELRLQRCKACGHITWPATEHCEACDSDKLEWERLSGKGKLISWCTFDQDYYRGMLPTPWDTIVVELEEGPLFLSNPAGFTNAEAEFGMPVNVCFIDCEDGNGAFKLPVFRAG